MLCSNKLINAIICAWHLYLCKRIYIAVFMKIVSLYIPLGLTIYNLFQDEKNQILTTNCWVTQVWTDHHLKWNASEFAGIRVIRVPYNRVWRPDTILYNKWAIISNQGINFSTLLHFKNVYRKERIYIYLTRGSEILQKFHKLGQWFIRSLEISS